MITRLLAAGLWLFGAIYAGSMLHGIAGVSEFVGPVVGLMTAVLIVAEPHRRVGPRRIVLPAGQAVGSPDVRSEPI